MAVDRWFIGGGAAHTPEAARRLAYAATGGAEGVGGGADLKVLPLETPGAGVRVTVGSGMIPSRYVGGETQTYMGAVYIQETVAVASTGGAARSDLIVFRVEDPFAAGSPWPVPDLEDITTAPYIHVRVISGVPSNTTRLQDVVGHEDDTAITLARVDLPASTSVVQEAMIVDLRQTGQPRRSEIVSARATIAPAETPKSYLTATVASGGQLFPAAGEGYANDFSVFIPEWASRMVIDARWMAVNYGADKRPVGQFWLEFGDEYRDKGWPGNQHYEFATQRFRFNASRNVEGSAIDWSLMDEVEIPEKLRGKTVTFAFKAGVTNSPGSNHTYMDDLSGLGVRLSVAESTLAATSF